MTLPAPGRATVAPGATHDDDGSTTGGTLDQRPSPTYRPRPALTRRSSRPWRVEVPGYGEVFADVYDDWYGDRDDVGPIVEAVSAGGNRRRLLELGAGTGRLAIPLAAAGHHVVALDDSAAMLERLGAKLDDATGEVIPVLADAAGPEVPEGPFDVVLGAFDFLANLADHDSQRRCLAVVGSRLAHDGVVILDGLVPNPDGATGTMRRLATRGPVLDGEVVLIETVSTTGSPTVHGAHVEATRGATRSRRWRLCLAGPELLDDFAASAGLRLLARTGDWHGAEFDPLSSPRHVSVYGR